MRAPLPKDAPESPTNLIFVSVETDTPVAEGPMYERGASVEREIVVPRFLTLAGRVTDSEGKPVPDVRVHVECTRTLVRPLATEDTQVAASTDERGVFRITRARPGGCKLTVSVDRGARFAEKELVLVADKDLDGLQLVLQPHK